MYDLTLASGLARHLVAAARPVEAHLFALTSRHSAGTARATGLKTSTRTRGIPAIAHTAAFAVAR